MCYKIARIIADPTNKVQWVFSEEDSAFQLRYGGALLLCLNIEEQSIIIQDKKKSSELPRLIGFDIEHENLTHCLSVKKNQNGKKGLLVISVEPADRIQYTKGASPLLAIDIITGRQEHILREKMGPLMFKKPRVLFVTLDPNSRVIINQKIVYQFLETEGVGYDIWTQAK